MFLIAVKYTRKDYFVAALSSENTDNTCYIISTCYRLKQLHIKRIHWKLLAISMLQVTQKP